MFGASKPFFGPVGKCLVKWGISFVAKSMPPSWSAPQRCDTKSSTSQSRAPASSTKKSSRGSPVEGISLVGSLPIDRANSRRLQPRYRCAISITSPSRTRRSPLHVIINLHPSVVTERSPHPSSLHQDGGLRFQLVRSRQQLCCDRPLVREQTLASGSNQK